MSGPERLEDDARPARRRTWVVVAVAVLAAAGLGAVRLGGLVHEPSPPAPTPSTGSTSVGWPEGIGHGTLYALDARGVVTVDLGNGLVQRSSLDVDPISVTLTAGAYGVLVWPDNGAGTAHQVAPGVPPPGTVSGVLADGKQFLPGPGLGVWVSPDDVGGDGDRATWRLVDEAGAVQQTTRTRGIVTADGSGGLFALDGSSVRHVVPGQPDASWNGSVAAIGPDGWETLRCVRHRCEDVLHDRTTGRDVPLAYPTPSDFGAELSPSNRFVATLDQLSDADDSPTVVRVSVPGDRFAPRTVETSDDAAAYAWVSDRWLAATGPHGLVLYDAVDDRLVTPDVALDGPRQLVFQAA